MKNPFLQDRNIFSKVQKQTTAIRNPSNQKQTPQIQNKFEQRKTYTATNFNNQPTQKSTTFGPSTAGFTSTYQRQAPKQPLNQYNLPNNNKFNSQKITFGDPSSSQAYHGQKTSGYFNMFGTQNHGNRPQISYDKYEPKINNFTGVQKNPYSRNSFAIDLDMKQTKKFDKGYSERNENKMDYEFTPPPINNFSNEYQPNQKKYGYKPADYDYKSNIQTQQEHQPYSGSQQYNDRFTKPNPFISQQKSQSFKSPPKPNQPSYTPKNDISYQFRQNNYAQLSPIGEVSHHRIEQDSLVNLDGLIENVQLDKLLAQSKTQQELLKILGMDTSIIKQNHYQQQSIKKITPQDSRTYQFQQKKVFSNTYLNQRQNQFSKKVYQQESYTQKVYQNQNYNEKKNQNQTYDQENYPNQNNFREDQQPQVLNYAQNYGVNQMSNKSKTYNTIKQTQTYNLPEQKSYTKRTQEQLFNPNQYEPISKSYDQSKQNQNSQQDDLQTIIQKQMEKFILQKEGPLKGKRIFMTPSQKIVTKKYNLAPL